MSPFDVVRENLTARQVAEYYGLKVNRNGMACCPFHDDRSPSMKIDNRYYCFGCLAKGDAVDYVARLFGLGPKDAAEKICVDLGLAYDRDRRGSPPGAKPVKPKKTDEQLFKEAEKYVFFVLCDYHDKLLKWKTEYAPKSPDEEFHPYFVEALREIDHVEYLLDTLLDGDISDRAFLISEYGRKVQEIEKRLRRINEHAAGSDREGHESGKGNRKKSEWCR